MAKIWQWALSDWMVLRNGEKVKDLDYVVSKEQAIGGKFTVIRRGKKKYFLIKHV